MSTMLVTAGIYGRRIRLVKKPQEEPHCKVNYQSMQTALAMRRQEENIHECMYPDKP